MDFTIKEPQVDTYEYGDYVVAVQWKPQWLHFEATLYMKTRTGHLNLVNLPDYPYQNVDILH